MMMATPAPLLLAIENDLDHLLGSVAMFLTASFGCCLASLTLGFFFGCKAPLLLGASRPWKWNRAITIRPEEP